MATQTEAVEFLGSQGERLAGQLDWPIRPPRAFALFAHCFTCSKESKAATYVAQSLIAADFAVLRFDFTGLGASAGEFAATHFSSNIADLVAAADWLRVTHRAPALLVGHSLGGTAALAAAARIAEVRAIATIGSPFEPSHVLHLLRGGEAALERADEAEVDIGGRSFRIRRSLIDDLRAQGPTKGLVGKGLLVMHSPRDRIVSIDNATQLFTAAHHPKSFVSLDPADHLLTRRDDGLFAGTTIAAWAQRYVPDERSTPPAAIAGAVVVRETREGKFTNHVVSGRHVLRADEPPAVGGLDSGPGPYDYLAAALGACTAMTLRMYADLKKLPLERVTVEVRHDKIHATDCADCETKEGKIDRLERVIRVDGALEEAMRAKLLEIADKCPVHRTLHAEVTIPTRVEPG